MKADPHGFALPGETSSTLAVRADYDIPVDDEGLVRPEEPPAGMSVTPDDWRHMRRDRIPEELGGDGKHPMFYIDTEELGPLLRFRRDPDNPVRHGFIEPAHPMSFEAYRAAIHATAALWRRVA
jgi:hypothetical protein